MSMKLIHRAAGRLTAAALVVTLVAVGAMLSACETSEGFGRDLQNLGDAIEDEAREDK